MTNSPVFELMPAYIATSLVDDMRYVCFCNKRGWWDQQRNLLLVVTLLAFCIVHIRKIYYKKISSGNAAGEELASTLGLYLSVLREGGAKRKH
jgi:hypothetical protein